jgi:hypothetical protein
VAEIDELLKNVCDSLIKIKDSFSMLNYTGAMMRNLMLDLLDLA